MKKLTPKNKRLVESINASREDIADLYYALMLYNLLMHFQDKIFKRPNDFIKWSRKEHKKLIKSIKSPYSQFRNNNQMNDFILYTTDGVQVPLRYVLRSAKGGDQDIDATNNLIRTYIDSFESDIVWDVFEKIAWDYHILK
ncbi:hypothetical protein [Candidatus Pelagibacter sp. HIMB1746]|uniref:hypothetical protein n=1 Tax=Candidatus Pelagibacter sp. HIMB1746 TaxID=3413370 RepID=UPI003F85A1FD